MGEAPQKTISLDDALNPYISYAKAAEIVKESVANGESITGLARKRKLLSEEEIAQILDPARVTEPHYLLCRRLANATGRRTPARDKGRRTMGISPNLSHWVVIVAGAYLALTGLLLRDAATARPSHLTVPPGSRWATGHRWAGWGRRGVLIAAGLLTIGYGLFRLL